LALTYTVVMLYMLARYVIEAATVRERFATVASFGFAFAWMFMTLIVSVQYTREYVDDTIASNNLKHIGIAMHSHHDAYDGLPAAVAYRPRTGKPGLSWRVALLPYLEGEGLYQAFKLDEPWDSPHNKKLIARMPRVYALRGKDDEARKGL